MTPDQLKIDLSDDGFIPKTPILQKASNSTNSTPKKIITRLKTPSPIKIKKNFFNNDEILNFIGLDFDQLEINSSEYDLDLRLSEASFSSDEDFEGIDNVQKHAWISR